MNPYRMFAAKIRTRHSFIILVEYEESTLRDSIVALSNFLGDEAGMYETGPIDFGHDLDDAITAVLLDRWEPVEKRM